MRLSEQAREQATEPSDGVRPAGVDLDDVQERAGGTGKVDAATIEAGIVPFELHPGHIGC